MSSGKMTEALVKQAMTDAWNEIVSTTGRHPDDIEHNYEAREGNRGRIDYTAKHWTHAVAMRLSAALSCHERD